MDTLLTPRTTREMYDYYWRLFRSEKINGRLPFFGEVDSKVQKAAIKSIVDREWGKDFKSSTSVDKIKKLHKQGFSVPYYIHMRKTYHTNTVVSAVFK